MMGRRSFWLLVLMFMLGGAPMSHADSWFDGLSEEALQWIFDGVRQSERYSTHGYRARRIFGNVEINYNFFQGRGPWEEEVTETIDPPGCWDFSTPQTPTWVDPPPYDQTTTIQHGAESARYWIRITDLPEELAKYISGKNKIFKSYEDIIQEIKDALSDEDLRILKADALARDRAIYLRFLPFRSPKWGLKRAPLISSETPVATADRTGIRIAQNLMLNLNKDITRQKKRISQLAATDNMLGSEGDADASGRDTDRHRIISGTITYEEFEYYEIDGDTTEVLLEWEQGIDDYSYGVLAPVSSTDIGWGDWNKLGLIGYFKKDIAPGPFLATVGISLAGEQTWMEIDGFDDSLGYGVAPYGSLAMTWKEVTIGVGTNLLYMENDTYDAVAIMTSAINALVPIGSNILVTAYAFRTDNLDDGSDYWTLGGSGAYMVSDVFGLTLGANTVDGLEEFRSTSYHFGGNWRY